MEDRRKSRRSDLDIRVEILRVDGEKKEILIPVHVLDMSRSGLGFISDQELDEEAFYNTKIRIWTGETLQTVIKIIRQEKKDDMYYYGSTFVGMPESDKLKVDIYQIVNPEE